MKKKTRNIIVVVFVGLILFMLIFYPNLTKAIDVSSSVYYAPSDGWYKALLWLRDNTPEPLGDPEAYYNDYEYYSFNYPETAYGVTSWWDYGYWITRIAKRFPTSNPAQTEIRNRKTAKYLLSSSVPHDSETLNTLKWFGTKYVIIDYAMTLSKYYAIATWADKELSQYIELYYFQLDDGRLAAKYFYYPDYYRTLVVRLFYFNGEAFNDATPIVLDYKITNINQDKTIKLITGLKAFSTYKEALDYQENGNSDNRVIVGMYPSRSPIELEELPGYKNIYNTVEKVKHYDWDFYQEVNQFVILYPEVKIFEYEAVD